MKCGIGHVYVLPCIAMSILPASSLLHLPLELTQTLGELIGLVLIKIQIDRERGYLVWSKQGLMDDYKRVCKDAQMRPVPMVFVCSRS